MSKRISDEAVEKATGKNWNDWFKILDKSKAKTLAHKDIASLLHKKYSLSGWWSQMITVTYEQERGSRKKHEKPSGYEISKSKTMNVNIDKLAKAWTNSAQRKKWLGDIKLAKRKTTAENTLRFSLEDNTIISVTFYPKGKNKTQVVVQHNKIKTPKSAEKMKTFWFDKLQSLFNHLTK